MEVFAGALRLQLFGLPAYRCLFSVFAVCLFFSFSFSNNMYGWVFEFCFVVIVVVVVV